MLFRKFALALSLFGLATLAPAAANPFPQLDKVGDDFTFVIDADPHVSREAPGQQRPFNEYLRATVREVNAMTPQPAFMLFLGDDFERRAAPESCQIFTDICKQLKPLPILVAGNHDVRTFDVDKFFNPTQQALNGYNKEYFSFNCGQWHFVVLPPKELITPQNEDQLMGWLDADLKANQSRPTIAFIHQHVLPIGTTQLEYYTLSIAFKNRLMEALAKYGNVRYMFNGHVHNGIKASVKTATRYKGVTYILGPTGVNPRPFGEEYPGYAQEEGGYYLVVEIKGKEARLIGRQNGVKEGYVYPPANTFPEVDKQADPRYFTALGDLPANPTLRNGGFEEGLAGWIKVHRYLTDTDPGYTWQVSRDQKAAGQQAARLGVKIKSSGWGVGECTELYQVAQAPKGGAPLLKARYFHEANQRGGGYLWLAGLKGREVRTVMVFPFGEAMENSSSVNRVINYLVTAGESDEEGTLAKDSIMRTNRSITYRLPHQAGQWHELQLNLADVLGQAMGRKVLAQPLGCDKYVVGLGAWADKSLESLSTVCFDEISLTPVAADQASTIDGQPLNLKDGGRGKYNPEALKTAKRDGRRERRRAARRNAQ